jgi:hypothetical protein
MHYIHKISKEHFSGDPSECPWPLLECICYNKSETPPQEVLDVPTIYRIIDGNNIRVATIEEQNNINLELEQQNLPNLKSEKITLLMSHVEQQELAGINIDGLVMAYSEYDQRRLATLLVGINEGLQLGVLTLDSPITVTQADNTDVTITVLQFKQLLVKYMFACLQSRGAIRQLIQQINSVNTKAELEAIQV